MDIPLDRCARRAAASAPWERVGRPLAAALLAGTLGIGAGHPAAAGASVNGPGSVHALRLGMAQRVALSPGAAVSRTIPLATRTVLGARPAAALFAAASPHRLVLDVGDITFSAPPSVAYEVYVDLPAGAKPDPGSPYHAGSLTFYGLDGRRTAANQRAAGQIFDITPLARMPGFDPSKLTVTFVPFDLVTTPHGAPGAPRHSDVVVGRIEVRVADEPRG